MDKETKTSKASHTPNCEYNERGWNCEEVGCTFWKGLDKKPQHTPTPFAMKVGKMFVTREAATNDVLIVYEPNQPGLADEPNFAIVSHLGKSKADEAFAEFIVRAVNEYEKLRSDRLAFTNEAERTRREMARLKNSYSMLLEACKFALTRCGENIFGEECDPKLRRVLEKAIAQAEEK